MSSASLLIIIGLVLILLAVARSVGGQLIFSIENRSARWAIGILGGFLFVLGLAGVVTELSLFSPQSPQPLPTNEQVTQQTTTITVTPAINPSSESTETSPQIQAPSTLVQLTTPTQQPTQLSVTTPATLVVLTSQPSEWFVPTGWDNHTEYRNCYFATS